MGFCRSQNIDWLVDMSKHTAGPWKYLDKNGKFLDSKGWEVENYHCDNFSYIPVTDGKNVVALVVVKGDDENILIKNAQPIAIAPELLEALEQILSMKPTHGMNPNAKTNDPPELKVGWNVHAIARNAIAKARGEA